MRQRNFILFPAALLVLIAAVIFTVVLTRGGAKEGVAAPSINTASVQLQLDKVIVIQEGKSHEIPPGSFRDQVKDLVLEPGEALILLKYTNEKVPVGEQVTLVDEQAGAEQVKNLDSNGQTAFLLNLVLDDQNWKLNSFELKAPGNDRTFQLLVMQMYSGGNVGPMVNTVDGLGVQAQAGQPTTPGFEVDPIFQQAFSRFCGFSVADGAKASLVENDEPRYQVAWTGTSFVESRHVIAVGSPIWAAISKKGDMCYINPPCGNPQVTPGKLPLAPLELQPPKEVMLPTPTPVVGSSPTPPATSLPPTATYPPPPPPPTQTAAPRPTEIPPCPECLPPPTYEPPPPTWEATATPPDIWNPTPTTRPPVGPSPTNRPPSSLPTALP